jgi:transglutaminase-like putative cysteine protease
VNTPPGLVGAALVFWGWQAGLLLFAVPLALALEAARLVRWRWELAPSDVRRIADLCRLVLGALAVYLWATRGTARTVLGLVEWFPLAVFPLVACQAYGHGDRIDLRTFFLVFRRRRAGADEPVNVAFPYLVVCAAAASAANVRTPAFYVGVLGLAAWALWPIRSRAHRWPVWVAMLAMAAGAGWLGQAGLHELQGVLEGTVAEWWFDYAGRNPDPFRARTALGSIGRLKLSDRILVRVDTRDGPRPDGTPLLLHEASYDVYAAATWGSTDTRFTPVPSQPDRRTWDLDPTPAAGAPVTIAASMRNGRGMVLAPLGTVRLAGLLALQMKRNRLGALKVEDAVGLASYRAHVASGVALGGPPSETDLKVPAQEAGVVGRIAGELDLRARAPGAAVETVRRYLASQFRYATYLDGVRRGNTALEDFLVRTHAGHCEYFATATVLLLRAAGVPARYAVGYSVQEWSPREGRYLVRARHGHAWALAWVEGRWREVDTTPPVWSRAEAEGSAIWQPLVDLGSWAMFLFARWRWADQDPTSVRAAGWLLVPLLAFLAWRLARQRRVAREAAARRMAAPSAAPRPGADSEFYLVEARLSGLGRPRRPWEPVPAWLGRIAATDLAPLAALHYRLRFDPDGLPPAEREALRAGVRTWLEGHPAERGATAEGVVR